MPADPRPDWVLAQRAEIGLRIARLRAARGLTVDGLASASGLDRKTVLRAEAGSRWVRLDVVLLLAAGLGVRPGTLLDMDEPAAGTGAADGGR